MKRNRKLKNTEDNKQTCIDVLTDVYDTWCLTNATSCYVEYTIKHVRMTIVHANPIKQKTQINYITLKYQLIPPSGGHE